MSRPARFDEIIHAPKRLRICAFLDPVDAAEFAAVRASLEVSDSVLSKHVAVLEEAGYLRVHKATVVSRLRTWLSLTAAGRRAFDGHCAALREMLPPDGAVGDADLS